MNIYKQQILNKNTKIQMRPAGQLCDFNHSYNNCFVSTYMKLPNSFVVELTLNSTTYLLYNLG